VRVRGGEEEGGAKQQGIRWPKVVPHRVLIRTNCYSGARLALHGGRMNWSLLDRLLIID
jgi:hypothetical protein